MLAQKYTSALTSRPQVPALMRAVQARYGWQPGTTNFDMGGGRYDLGTRYLAERGVRNLIFDPFNRQKAHNFGVMQKLHARGADTVTCANVLNVIAEPEVRDHVVGACAKLLRAGGAAFFSVYCNPAGKRGTTRDGWQEHRPLSSYLPEVGRHFGSVERVGALIVATKS